MEGTKEAEMIVQFAMQGISYTLRLAGDGAKNIVAMLAALKNQPESSPGSIRMKSLLQSGEPLDYYSVPEGRMQEFSGLAKKYGIQYCVALNQDGMYDLVVKKSDSARINRVAEMIGLGTVQGEIGTGLSEEEKAGAMTLSEAEMLMQDMMSPNRKEREAEINPGIELPDGSPSGSSYRNTDKNSVLEQIKEYGTEMESTRDLFATARNLRENMMQELPDGMERTVVEYGWEKPAERYNENGERLYRGKTAEEMTETDRMQYMVDAEMLANGRLSEDFIRQMYLSGYQVDANGNVEKHASDLTGREKLLIADMMREPEGRTPEKTNGAAAKKIKEAVNHEH